VKVAPGVRIGPYEVMEHVGRGGMATVYKAHHQALEWMVATKVLPDFLAEDPRSIDIKVLKDTGLSGEFDAPSLKLHIESVRYYATP